MKSDSPSIHKKIIRFSLTGIFITSFHAFIAVLFIEYLFPSPPLANGTAFLLATALSYLINTRWSFSCPLKGDSFFRFICVSSVGLVLAVLVSWYAQLWGFGYLEGIGAVILTVPGVTFILHNYWTYN